MDRAITSRDEPLIREWLNCQTAEVDADGGVWVEGPMAGHWLNDDRLDEYREWRHERLTTPDHHPDQRLATCGQALYGARWQSELARALGVNDRRVRQWISGERRIPQSVWTDIAELLRQRREDIDALLADMA